jgi:hypothetical protein
MDQLTNIPTPTLEDLEAARADYESREPRDLFYRAATELVDLAIRGATRLSLAEALAVLLQTWNSAFYRFHQPFDAKHFADIDELVSRHQRRFRALRPRSISTLSNTDEEAVKSLFAAFEGVLGPVGAAKALHLLAPRFFPLWDTAIAQRYRLPMKPQGLNAGNYWQFMSIVREQCIGLGEEEAVGRNPLKALDEYNYCDSHPTTKLAGDDATD